MKRSSIWVAGVLFLCGMLGHAQQAAPGDRQSAVQVQLGDSAVDLFGPWRFHVGDDPAWAQPGFDDAGWEAVDLHAPDDPPHPELGTSGFAPGWTTKGHPSYFGYAWYRLRVKVQGANGRLALKMPDSFDDAYQIFVNGQEVGQFGHFGRHQEWAYPSQPRGFPLPPGLQDGVAEIAIRMWMDSGTRFTGPDVGGLHGPPTIGTARSIADQVALDWDILDHQIGSGFLEMLVLLLALTVAVTHFVLDRSERAYLWLALVCLATLLSNLVMQIGNFTATLSTTAVLLSRDVVLAPLRIGFWVFFWATWFKLRMPAWFHRCVWALVGLLAFDTLLLRPPLHGQLVPVHDSVVLSPAALGLKVGLAVLLFWVTYRGIREDRAEGWFALPAILLAVVANYHNELRAAHIHVDYLVLGYSVSLSQISIMLSLLLVTVMGSGRFLRAQREKVRYRLEVEQASELQRVIVPRDAPQIPGLRIESEYRPSREVGGDFYQIVPDRADGSVLIVVGDVTGKGLLAGMLVALIVGVIDTAAKESVDPVLLLQNLNDGLCDRGFATATCLALRICADGTVTVASAGHPPPYLNGNEMDMPGALPLGMLPGIVYEPVEYRLRQGDTLTLVTDGVAEAQDEDGALFGFERISEMVSRASSAATLADAAQQFGQEDDILVLRVERTSLEPSLVRA
jgi:hypothetical protein